MEKVSGSVPGIANVANTELARTMVGFSFLCCSGYSFCFCSKSCPSSKLLFHQQGERLEYHAHHSANTTCRFPIFFERRKVESWETVACTCCVIFNMKHLVWHQHKLIKVTTEHSKCPLGHLSYSAMNH